jgi:hypothetical protein
MQLKTICSLFALLGLMTFTSISHAQGSFVGTNTIEITPTSGATLTAVTNCYELGNCTRTPDDTVRIYPKVCDGAQCTGCYAYQQGRLTRVSGLNSAGTCDAASSPRIEVLTLYRADCPGNANTCNRTGKLSIGCRIRTIAGTDATQNVILPPINQECFSGRPLVIDQLATTGTQQGGSCNNLKINIEGVISPSPLMTSTARFDAKVFGGSGAITYQLWNDQNSTQISSPSSQALPGGQAGRRYTNLPAGRYEVRATDAAGCQVSAVATICGLGVRVTSLTHQSVLPTASGGTIVPSVADGSVEVSIDGYSVDSFGNLPGAVTWNATRASGAGMPSAACYAGSCGTNSSRRNWGVSGTSPQGLPADVYSVRVTDWNGCVAETKFEIEEKVQTCGSGMQPGSSGCVVCPAGTYKSARGNFACTSCGSAPANGTLTTRNISGTSTITGAKSPNDCKLSCNSPYVLDTNGQSCISPGSCSNLVLSQLGTETWTDPLFPTTVSKRWKLSTTGGATMSAPISISMAREAVAPNTAMPAPVIQYTLAGGSSGSGDPKDSTITAPPGHYVVTGTATIGGTVCTKTQVVNLGPSDCRNSNAFSNQSLSCASASYVSPGQVILIDPSIDMSYNTGGIPFPNPGSPLDAGRFWTGWSGSSGHHIYLETTPTLTPIAPNTTCKVPLPGGWKTLWNTCWVRGTSTYNWNTSYNYNRCSMNSGGTFSGLRIVTNGACPAGTTDNDFTNY